MEILTFLIVLAVLIFLLINNSNIQGRLKDILREIEQLKATVAGMSKTEKTEKISEQPSFSPIPVEKPSSETRETVPESKPIPEVRPVAAFSEPVASSYDDTVKAKLEAMQQHEPQMQSPVSNPAPPRTPKPPKQPTDFEKFIGENLISKIGIIILVLGVGFFVKYAIDQNWIGVYGRTAIGLVTGGILVALAHYLRKSYKTFSSLLTGGGFAVFYLTIAISFHQYKIFSPTVAFLIMVLITIFSVILSLAYDKKELAIFSQIGGYAAPFMISTGDGNYLVLFSYMLILNAGLLVLAYYKRWHILNLLAFLFTIIIFSGWLATTFWGSVNLPYRNALIFASAFYLVFFLANILNNLKERKPFKAVEITMILSNNLFFFLSGLTILYSYQQGIYKGLFTVLVGLFNFGWVIYLYKQKQVDKNLIYLLVALVMSYISLAIPIQLNGHSITLFWTAEFVILLWLSQMSSIKILKTGHLVVLALVIISLFMDWSNLYQYYSKVMPVIFNQAFITGICVIAGLSGTILLLRKEREDVFVPGIITTPVYIRLLTFLLFAAAFMVPFLELNYQMKIYYPSTAFQVITACIYAYAYLFIVLLLITRQEKWKAASRWVFHIAWIALLFYFFIFHSHLITLRDTYLFGKNISTGNFLFHYLALPFIVGIIVLLYRGKKVILGDKGLLPGVFSWFVTILLVFIASEELDNIMILTSDTANNSYYHIRQVSHKVGYPILWAVSAFVLIIWGLRAKVKVFRIQAMSLFALIILKLFLFDVWSMSEGGRIAAFVFLGVVLLIVSFLYQKLKNLLLDKSGENLTGNQL